MGKWFDYSGIIDKRKDMPILTSKNGKTTLRRKVKKLKDDMPILYKDEDGNYVIEKSILDTPYCGKCLRNHYDPQKPREHFVCTIDNLWNCLPDKEQDSFGKNCNYNAPLILPNYSRTVSETTAKRRERPGKLSSFFKERAISYNNDLRIASWGEECGKQRLIAICKKT